MKTIGSGELRGFREQLVTIIFMFSMIMLTAIQL